MHMKKRVAFITGGSRGIGLGIAHQLAEAAFDIAINGVRDAAEVAATIEKLKSFGTRVIYCQGNVASAPARAAMIDQIKKELGALHILVNNAGIAPRERKDI